MADYLKSYRKLAGLTEAEPSLGADDRDPQKFVKERVYFTYKGDKYETVLTKHGDIELYKFDGATPMFQGYVKSKITGAWGVAKLIIDNRKGKFDRKIALALVKNVKKAVKMPPDTTVLISNTPPKAGYDGKGVRPGTLYILLGRPRHEQEEGKWLANYVHQGGRSTSGHYYDSPEEAAKYALRHHMENLGRMSAAQNADHLLGRGRFEEANTDLWFATNHNGRKLHNKPLPIKQAAEELFKYEGATGNQGSLVHFDQAKKGDFVY